MKLGISSFAFTWAVGLPGHRPAVPLSASGLIDRALQLDVTIVQFGDNLPLHALSPDELNRLETTVGKAGISAEVGTRGLQAERVLEYLKIAERLHSPILRLVVDEGDDRPTEDECVARLEPLLPAFRDAGITCAIENHDRFPARILKRILERLDSPHVGICLDTANSLGCLEGLETVVEALAPSIVNLHLKDVVARRIEGQMGFAVEGVPAGQGQVDAPWLLGRLREAGRDVNVILEQWVPYAGNLEETITREDAWARSSVAYLREVVSVCSS